MGFFDRFRNNKEDAMTHKSVDAPSKVFVGANNDNDETQIQSFNNTNITFSGELAGYDYDSILRDKQNWNNLKSLFQLSDYFTDADPIIHALIKHVFVPFSTCSDWFLTGAKDKTCKLYEEQYKKMRLREKLDGIMLEYWKYGNVYAYFYEGQLITLPVHKCRIGGVALNGMPIVEYDCQTTLNEWRAKGYSIKENWIKDNDLKTYFKGFPEEIQEGLNKGLQYVQLNPENTFVMQGSKESWQRYAIPFIASCLSSLSKKELISKYEDSLLNLGIRSFVHVRYGDEKNDILPDKEQLVAVRKLFQKGMSGFPLVTTNQLAKAEVIQPDLDDLFQWDKYKDVNNAILSAGGISGIIVTGVADDGSNFATAQVSMQTAETRINAARDEFCELMNRVNARLTEEIKGTYNLKEVPEFHFTPLDMSGKKALRETCQHLWELGLVSTKTMMETHGYAPDVEKEQRSKEKSDKTDEVLAPRVTTAVTAKTSDGNSSGDGKVGRPEMDDDERTSDPSKSETGKAPKPSNEDGSGDQKA